MSTNILVVLRFKCKVLQIPQLKIQPPVAESFEQLIKISLFCASEMRLSFGQGVGGRIVSIHVCHLYN